MLQVQIIGNLCKDAETKQINDYTYIAFRVAVNTKKDETLFLSVLKRQGDNASSLPQYLTKGKKVYVQGRISLQAYVNKDGEAIPDMTIWSDRIELLGGAENNNEQTTEGGDLPF